MTMKRIHFRSFSQAQNLSVTAAKVSRRGFLTTASGLAVAMPFVGMRDGLASETLNEDARESAPLVIARQGSFSSGGSVLTSPGTFNPFVNGGPGQTLHGDHCYAQFQIPFDPRELPLVMWHGGGQMGKTWESTTDGREGYQSIFLRRDFSIYIIDQPRRGRAGETTQGVTITPTPGDQDLFIAWRLGIWPNFYPNTKFPQTPDALDQFFRQFTVDTGPSNRTVVTDGVAALFAKIGPAVLLTHSASGILGWLSAIKSPNVAAIYAYEPTDYVFPEGQVPPAMGGQVGNPVALDDFLKLTKIPIRIQYSDHIPTSPSPYPRLENWRNRVALGTLMVSAINQNGGDASILHLPDVGIFGNTHFSFSDVNNIQIADLLSHWLSEKHLDRR